MISQRSLRTLNPGPYGGVVNDVSPPGGSDANLPPWPLLQQQKHKNQTSFTNINIRLLLKTTTTLQQQ